MPLSVDSTQRAEPIASVPQAFCQLSSAPCQRSSGSVCIYLGLHRARVSP